MQYEFNISPDRPIAKYDAEGNLDTSVVFKDGKIISKQRTGIIDLDSGVQVFVKDGDILDLPESEIYKLNKPQPISYTINYTQSSVYSDDFYDEEGNIEHADINIPANSRNMTNGVYSETRATGTNGNGFQYIQMDLGGAFNIKGVVVGCDYNPNVNSIYLDESGNLVSPDSNSESGLWGNWGKYYTENLNVEYSKDGVNWTFLFNAGEFNKPIQKYDALVFARYIRIVNNGYLCVTEFYAF